MKTWTHQQTDQSSGRQIFKRDVAPITNTIRHGYDFKVAADFEVRDAQGQVLMSAYGMASGEYWCGVFLWFVKGSSGTQVRLDESDKSEDTILDVPDQPKTMETPAP